MKDAFGRTITYLRLSVTDRCNLRCRYCMPASGVPSVGRDGILTYEELLTVAEAAVELGVRKIRVTGGEPLVRQGIVPFIAALCRLPGAPEVVLTTNGLRLAELAGELAGAGLARVNVSLDTLRPKRYPTITRREGLERVLAGLHAAEAAGLTPLKLNMVPLRGVNDDEIVDFARLTMDNPWEVRFIEFMPVGPGTDYSAGQRVAASAIQAELARLGSLLPVIGQDGGGPARLYRYPGSRGTLGIIPAVSGHLCRDCNRLRVTADGRIRLCLLEDREIDLRERLRAGATRSEIRAILAGAAGAKPKGHLLGSRPEGPPGRPMTAIGG